MLTIKILLVVFFLLALAKVVGRYRAGDLGPLPALGWMLFWCAAGFVVILPDSSAYFAKLFGIGRGADLVVYLSLAFLFYLIFRATVRAERMSRDVTVLTRKITLMEADKKDEHKPN